MLSEQTLVKERYLLLRILGKGGFSEVWLADDRLTSTQVALKFYASSVGLDDEGIQLFIREFSLLSDLNHSNLLKPSHYDHFEKMPFLVLTYCENGSALKLINRMTEEKAWLFLRDVSEGLHYLHSNKPPIIHQDIKPDNILIDKNDRFVITDFGISTRIRRTLRKATAVAATGGTQAYMPPERFGRDPSPIKASDIYSLGATMFELLTGEIPFGELGGLSQKNGADIPLIKRNYSNQLKDIVYRCLARDAWERPTALEISACAGKMLKMGVGQGPVPNDDGDIDIDNDSGIGSGGGMDIGGGSGTKNIIAVLAGGLVLVVFIIAAFFVVNRASDNLEKKKALYEYYIHQGDSLSGVGQKEDANFEWMYVDALKKYQMALGTVEKIDNLSKEKNRAQEKIDVMKELIKKTHGEFLYKAKRMKEDYDALPAAKVFTERANSLKDSLDFIDMNMQEIK
jgi:hypothetical protein